MVVGELDQAGGLALGFFADSVDAHFGYDLQSRAAGLERGDVRGSVHEAERRIGISDGAGCELEGILVGEPSGNSWFELSAEVGPDVEITDARAAAEPLENASAAEVDVEGLDVDRDRAERLKGVEHDVGADLVGFFDDGARVVDI